jgi:hypothetical protein
MIIYYKNNKGTRGQSKPHPELARQQTAGNVKQEGQIPEFNTLPMPGGSGHSLVEHTRI